MQGGGPGMGLGHGMGAGQGHGAGRGMGAGQGMNAEHDDEHGEAEHAGDSSFISDRDTFHYLLEHHDKIRRTVTKLDNGVETVTESDDPDVAAKIQEHVAAMYDRVSENRPIRMRDPLFAAVFGVAGKIDMKHEDIEKGVRVVETSDDPRAAQLIQAHAAVVSLFVSRGFSEAPLNHEVPEPGATITFAHSSTLTADQKQELLKASVDFDRLYIPALALTNEEKAKPAAKALERLKGDYASLLARVEQALEVPSSSSRPDPVLDAINKAIELVAAGEPKQAHEALEPIRDLTTKRRTELAIDYPMDKLNAYHEVMEEVVKPATKMTPAEVDAHYKTHLKLLAFEASEVWAEVEQTDFDAELFGFDPAAVESLDASIAQQRAAITKLNRALARDDAEAILKAAKGLKPPFAKMYKSFGNFEGLQPAGESR